MPAGTGYGAQLSLITPCFSGVVTGLTASVTNDTDFTASWSNVAGASGYALDVSTNNQFSGAGGGGDLIFSQYSDTDSGSTPKGVEIWNATGSDITFNSSDKELTIDVGVNGGAPAEVFSLTSGTLLAGDVLVIGTSDMSPDHVEAFTFNGDDSVVLKLGGVTTDVIGNPGSDPGSSWSGGGVSTADRNIQLKTGVSTGDTDGWTDPSTRFEDVSAGSTLTGFGTAPTGGSAPSYVAGYSNRVVAGTSLSVTGLTGGVTYYFRARATNDYCMTANSATSSVTTSLIIPDIAVRGNNNAISDGDTSPTVTDHTDFGRVGLINSNLVRVYTITNSGLATLTLQNVAIGGTHPGDFTVISQPTLSLSLIHI